MSKFTRPRGTRDFGPEELAHRRALEEIFRRTLEDFGFSEVQTPTFEHTDLFTAKSGDAILDQIYEFEDKGDRSLTLRPEITAPVMRYFVNDLQHLPKPLKLYYFANCFRYERPQSGRYREFWQTGLELIGPDTPEADAEVVGTAAALLMAAGLERHRVHVGHIGVLRAFLDPLDVSEDVRGKAYRLIDKRQVDELRQHLLDHDVAPETVETVAGLADTRGEVETATAGEDDLLAGVRDLVAGVEDAEAGLDHLEEVVHALSAYDLDTVTVNLGVARGLDYYTGAVFEVHHPDLGAESQICGGGAYRLAEVFGGPDVGTAGFGMGFDRVLLALEEEDMLPGEKEHARVFVIPIGDEARLPALELVNELRWAGIPTDVDLLRRGPSKNLDHANGLGAPLAVLVGSRELQEGVVTVKDMASGDQETVDRDAILDHLL